MKHLERAYPWLLIAPAALPVVVWSGLIYPYLVPKTLLFYALSFVSVAAFLLLVASGRAFFFARLRQWPAVIPAALLALAYLASWFGIDFYRSFWSVYVRGDGLLMLTSAIASFYLILLSADRQFFDRLVRAVALVGAVVAVYGIGEWILGGAGRVGSLLGNAAFFAGYLGVALFATLSAASGLSGWWRRWAFVGAALETIAIVLSATRGTMLALGVALVACLIFLAIRPSAPEEKNGTLRAARPSLIPFFSSGASGARIVLVTLVLFAGLFLVFHHELAQSSFEPIARIASISTGEADVASRLFIWRNMLGQIAAHPWLGTGAEHIDVAFNSFYDPTQIQEEWFDRSHNAFLDYAVEYGIGGLLLYLALILGFFAAARRLRERGESALAACAALLAVVYGVQNFFVFDTVSSFWLLLALLAVFLALAAPALPPRPLALPRFGAPLAALLALALVALIYPVSVKPAVAAYDLAHAYAYALVSPTTTADYLSRGFALGTYGDLEYGYEAYDIYVDHQHGSLSGADLTQAYRSAESILERNFNRYPYDARTALYFAHVLSLAPPGVAMDKNLLAEALARAIKESPKRYQPWYVLVNLSISEANTHPEGSPERAKGYAAARDLLGKYVALVPALAEPHFVLAELARAAGDTAEASREAERGVASYKSDLQTARRAASYFEDIKDWSHARYFLNEVVRMDPSDAASAYDLAKVTYLDGDPAAADALVKALRASAPGLLPSDPNFMAAIATYERSQH